jgi:hypothetical protein
MVSELETYMNMVTDKDVKVVEFPDGSVGMAALTWDGVFRLTCLSLDEPDRIDNMGRLMEGEVFYIIFKEPQ